MKRMSLSRKIRLAISRLSIVESIFWFMHILNFVALFLNNGNEKEDDIIGVVSISCGTFISFLYIFTLSNSFSSLKQFKTFPMTYGDFIDVMIYELITRTVIMSAVYSVLLLLFQLPQMIPHIICMFFAMSAAASLLIPFYLKTDSLRTGKPVDDSGKNRINLFKGISIIVIYMAFQAGIATCMIRFAFDSESLAGDVPVLAAVFAVSIVILMLIAKICGGSKKFSLEC